MSDFVRIGDNAYNVGAAYHVQFFPGIHRVELFFAGMATPLVLTGEDARKFRRQWKQRDKQSGLRDIERYAKGARFHLGQPSVANIDPDSGLAAELECVLSHLNSIIAKCHPA